MAERESRKVIDLMVGGYRLLLAAYPRGFRRRNRAGMVELFRDLCRRAHRTAGARGLLVLALQTLLEVPRHGLAERIVAVRTGTGLGVFRCAATGDAGARRPRAPASSLSSEPSRPPAAVLHSRSPHGDPFMAHLVTDLKYAVRSLRKQPVFTTTVIAMLALGIVGTTAIFSVFDALVLRPLPFEDAGRLVTLDERAPQWNLDYVGIAYPDFDAWRAANRSFEAMAVYDAESVNVSLDGEALRIEAARVSHEMVEVLGIRPLLGRDFDLADDVPGAPGVALLGQDLWEGRFGADPGVVGRAVRIDAEPFTVIGVLPRESLFIGEAELWTPLATDVEENPGSWYLGGVGRLREGISREAAAEDLERVHKGLIEERPANEVTFPIVEPLMERFLGEARLGASALMGAVGIVLLIACANVAGLMLARSGARAREIGIRAALGAGKRRIAGQILTEAVVLAAAGGVIGALLGVGGVRFLAASLPEDVPRWIQLRVDMRFLAFVAATTLSTALVFGLVPALRAAGTDAQQTLQAAATRATATRRRRRGLDLLVAGEVALALVLLVGAGLFMRSFLSLSRVDPGFQADGVISYAIALPRTVYAEDPQMLSFWQQHLEAVGALPGVSQVAAVRNPPLGGHTGYFFEIEGAPEGDPDAPTPVVLLRVVTPGYFRTLGIPLRAGRDFEPADGREGTPGTIIVNQTFVATFFPGGEDPVGRRVRFSGNEDWLTVVGVNHDVRHYGLDTPMRPGVYMPMAGFADRTFHVVARTAVPPDSLLPQIRALVTQADPGLPVFDVATMSERLAESLWNQRATSWMFGVFAGVALLLATGGIYGVVSYAVSQRTREMGIRLALGAPRASLLRQVLGQGAWVAALGALLGLPAAFAAARLLGSLLYGVTPWDPQVYAAVVAVLAGVALLANLAPARRAAAIDPMEVLRDE